MALQRLMFPIFRGMFLRGVDGGRNIDEGRSFASVQTDLIESHQHQGQSLSMSHFISNENFLDGNTTDVLGYRLGLFGGSSLANFMGRHDRLGRLVAQEGDRVERADAFVNKKTRTVTLTDGKIYIAGDIFPVSEAVLNNVSMIGRIEIGVKLQKNG